MTKESNKVRLGIDLGGTKTEIVALEDRNEKELYRKRVPTPKSYGGCVTMLVDLISEAEKTLGRRGTVGIGGPGSIDHQTGLLRNHNQPFMNGNPLPKDIGDRLDREIRYENDANCFAVSEAVDGAASNGDVVFGLIIGTGVGGGVVINKKPISGRNGIGGEVGHSSLPFPTIEEIEQSPLCENCGKKGCLESWLSGPAFKRDYNTATGSDLSNHDIVKAYRNREPAAVEVFERYCDRLARALADVLNLIDPDIIVAGGGMSNIPELYEIIPTLWAKYTISPDATITTPFKPALHGDSSGVRGAAWLWS